MTDFESKCRVTEETNAWQREQDKLYAKPIEIGERYERRLAEARSNPMALCRWLLKHDEDGTVLVDLLQRGRLALLVGIKNNSSVDTEIVRDLKRDYESACELYAEGEDDE